MKSKHGFTLIESVIVIVVMGLAMVTIVSFLSPQIARSGDPHYDTRAAALGQSVMTQILARGFDHHSDNQGGLVRCSSSVNVGSKVCSGLVGSETPNLGLDIGETDDEPGLYDDVDDFIGCWVPNGPGGENQCRNLNDLINDDSGSYKNFRLDVAVDYAQPNDASLKKLELTISASNHQPITLIGFRGNY
ncbi:type II secretion system protein [Vibrio cholerae]